MARRDAVLRPRRAHPYHFLRAQVGGDERQPADPCWQRPPRLEEVLARLHEALQRKADAQHKDEVQQHDQPINECQIQWIPLSPSPNKTETARTKPYIPWQRHASETLNVRGFTSPVHRCELDMSHWRSYVPTHLAPADAWIDFAN